MAMNARDIRLFTKARAAYFGAFSDETVVDHVAAICQEIKSKIWSDNEPLLGPIPVGRIYEISGFWHSRWLVKQLTSAYIGRACRVVFTNMSIKPESREAVKIMMMLDAETTQQIERVLPALHSRLESQLGDDSIPLDWVKMKEVKIEYINFLEHKFATEFLLDDNEISDEWPASVRIVRSGLN